MKHEPVSRGLEDFLAYLRDAEERHRMAEASRAEADAATQDLLHALELGEHHAKERSRLALKLREVRRTRREATETAEQTGPVAAWAEQNRATVKGLERLLGELRKLERKTETRTYIPRTHVLEEAQRKPQPHGEGQ